MRTLSAFLVSALAARLPLYRQEHLLLLRTALIPEGKETAPAQDDTEAACVGTPTGGPDLGGGVCQPRFLHSGGRIQLANP